jgi:hypothetical protein
VIKAEDDIVQFAFAKKKKSEARNNKIDVEIFKEKNVLLVSSALARPS